MFQLNKDEILTANKINEIISIFENVNHFGLPLPKKFKEYLDGLKSKKNT